MPVEHIPSSFLSCQTPPLTFASRVGHQTPLVPLMSDTIPAQMPLFSGRCDILKFNPGLRCTSDILPLKSDEGKPSHLTESSKSNATFGDSKSDIIQTKVSLIVGAKRRFKVVGHAQILIENPPGENIFHLTSVCSVQLCELSGASSDECIFENLLRSVSSKIF